MLMLLIRSTQRDVNTTINTIGQTKHGQAWDVPLQLNDTNPIQDTAGCPTPGYARRMALKIRPPIDSTAMIVHTKGLIAL